jgi:phosphoglycerate dehydrogenase-like enzyme
MAANATVMASTFRRTRVPPGTACADGTFLLPGSTTVDGMGHGRIWACADPRQCETLFGMPDAKPTVLVTDSVYRKGEACFIAPSGLECRPAPEAEPELAAAIHNAQARYTIVGNRQYTGALYESLPPSGVIARFGVGHDGIDKVRATAAQLLCTNTPGVLDQSVAEHTMLLVAAAARNLTPAMASMASGTWDSSPGRDLCGKTLAVIGCGGIGRAVARIAALGYGMHVVGCTRPDAPVPAAMDYFQFVTNDFGAAVRDADFVSLHMPAKPDTVRFINRERLAHFAERAWLINTARGAIVDEAALFAALTGGRIAGAALDVFAREPYVPAEGGGDLRSLSNVILTPHVGSNTVESNRRMADRALQNIQFAQAGQFERMDLLNPDVLRTIV